MISPAALGASLVCSAQERLDGDRAALPALAYGLSVGLLAALAVAGVSMGVSTDVVQSLLAGVARG